MSWWRKIEAPKQTVKLDIKGFTGLMWEKKSKAVMTKCTFCQADIWEGDEFCRGTMPGPEAGCCWLYACQKCSIVAGVSW